ncbi:MAG: DUF2357 domain-containing protein [Pseudomonadota bacterium]|nr:DUF2357 domain-containing protein [Pseudomonadota bacterium]
MNVLSRIQTEDFELVIRGNRVAQNQSTLQSTLKKRGQESSLKSSMSFAHPIKLQHSLTEHIFLDYMGIYRNSIPFFKHIFFENTQYAFDFIFRDSEAKPKLTHSLIRINECFYTEKNELHGQINFGNEIGRFQLPFNYVKAGKTINQRISFEVWPTKMDMRTDLNEINDSLDQAHPFLRFSFAKATEQNFSRSKQKHPPFDVLWIAQFQSLRDQILKGFKQVLNAPHNRLMPEQKSLKIHQLKGKQPAKLLQKVKQDINSQNFEKRYKVNQKRLSVDTPENQFIKYVLHNLVKTTQNFSNKVNKWDKGNKNERLSSNFYTQLNGLTTSFKRLQKHSLFKEISDFQGMKKASLVLQQKTGYSAIYRSWFELKSYLDVLGKDAHISQKNIAELYEVWCFLEMRRIFVHILKFNELSNLPEFAKQQGMEYQIPSGEKHAFEFEKGEGQEKIHVLLRHEKSFGRKNKVAGNKGIIAWMTEHKPDIYMEVNFANGEQFIWLFDAKYRIDLDSKDKDWVPQDALYQMHRYRDALVYRERPDENLSRPVYGAYALYPGYYENQSTSENPYQESINNIDIGAFPMLPGQKQEWLVEFLREMLGINSNNATFIQSQPATYNSTPFESANKIRQRLSAKITPR